jgi:hypothetical protein
MRKWCVAFLGTGALVAAVLGAPAAVAASPVQQSGDRIAAASAVLADPADCADGECDAVFLTAASGVLGAASAKVRISGILLVDVYPSTVVDGSLWPTAEPLFSGCTTEVDVAIAQRLTDGRVATHGLVQLNEFVTNDDGTFECSTPTGHWVDLGAVFTGVGTISSYSSNGTYSTPLVHEVSANSQLFRLATVDVTGALDGGALPPAWPDSGSLMRDVSRSLVLEHPVAVGPVVRELHVVKNAATVSAASGQAGDWSVEAMVARDPDGASKTYLGVGTMVGDLWCWGDGEPSLLELPTDLSGGTAAGSVTVYCGETGEEYGQVSVQATWTGVGTPTWFRSTDVFRSPEGSGTAITTGVNRDATLTLVVDGVPLDEGTGFLLAQATKYSSKVG